MIKSFKASAIASPNIALIKYWGKRDSELNLPVADSIALTVSDYCSHTTVEFLGQLKSDVLELNGEKGVVVKPEDKPSRVLDKIRQMAGIKMYAKIKSKNNFPTGAGLASSSSGLAALTVAAAGAMQLQLSTPDLSIIARQGSGSACRSLIPGLSKWKMGTAKDGSDSFAEPIEMPTGWDIVLAVITLNNQAKPTSSTKGMIHTQNTSPYFDAWVQTQKQDLNIAGKALIKKDLALLGKTMEGNALAMHASMLAARPPLFYLNQTSMDTIFAIQTARESGKLRGWFTIDAGPNVKVLLPATEVSNLEAALNKLSCVYKLDILNPGKGAKCTREHLF